MPNTNFKKQHFSPEKKLEILNLVSKDWPVSTVCFMYGINRSTFYTWKKRHEANQKLGLNRKGNTGCNHPLKTKNDISQQVIDFSIAHPEYGCNRVAVELSKNGTSISSPTIQKILIKENLGKIRQRVLRLEKNHVKEGWEITSNDFNLICKHNSCFRHIRELGSYPGEILVQDTFAVFDFFPNTYIYVVIDTYSYYSIAYPLDEKSAQMAIELISQKALKFFKGNHGGVKKIITSNGREFTKFNGQYTNFLSLKGITHEVYAGKEKKRHGYIEKYKSNFLKRIDKIPIENPSVISIQKSFKLLFEDHRQMNRKLRNIGFPTFGVSPLNMVNHFKK